jgi:hypothetical protein
MYVVVGAIIKHTQQPRRTCMRRQFQTTSSFKFSRDFWCKERWLQPITAAEAESMKSWGWSFTPVESLKYEDVCDFELVFVMIDGKQHHVWTPCVPGRIEPEDY